MVKFGASFSLHRCNELGLDKQAVLKASIKDLGLRRFRLMSYWNVHEQTRGKYDFSELDWQLDLIAEAGGQVTLCLGKRQPRWPECHMPKWAQSLSQKEWYDTLYAYIREVVERYKDHPALETWQLENEALLKSFGHCTDGDYNHGRLRKELKLVKKLDPSHPVIMTLSDSWGIPVRGPRPDKYAMSLYRITINQKGHYAFSKRPPLFYKARRMLIIIFKLRPTFIHELQAEPWLPVSITKVPLDEQLKYMNSKLLEENVAFARKTGSDLIDLWGLEWWYWLRTKHDKPEVWDAAKELIAERE
jgi:hypothetical protein